MTENRKFNRYGCQIKAECNYYEGDPETIDVDISVPIKSKGTILDISGGGLFLVSNEKVSVNMPMNIKFKTKKNNYEKMGKIVRTGLLVNNPSEAAQKFSGFSTKGDSYIALEFDDPIEDFSQEDL